MDPGTGQDPFLNTFFPNYADLVTDESVGPCPDCGIFTQTLGNALNRQFIIRWKANYFNSPPGPAQAGVRGSIDRRLEYAVGDLRGDRRQRVDGS